MTELFSGILMTKIGCGNEDSDPRPCRSIFGAPELIARRRGDTDIVSYVGKYRHLTLIPGKVIS